MTPVDPGLRFAHPAHGRAGIKEGRHQAQVHAHREQEERHGEYQADDQQAQLLVDLVLARLRFDILGFAAGLDGFEAGFGDCLADLRLADQGGNIFDAGAF